MSVADGAFRIHAFPRSRDDHEAFDRLDTCPACRAMFDLTDGKPLVSISDIRDAFNTISLPKGIRCTDALLTYCDKAGKPDGPRDHQQLVFTCVNSNDNTAHRYTSALLPPGASVLQAAQDMANKAIGA